MTQVYLVVVSLVWLGVIYLTYRVFSNKHTQIEPEYPAFMAYLFGFIGAGVLTVASAAVTPLRNALLRTDTSPTQLLQAMIWAVGVHAVLLALSGTALKKFSVNIF